MHVILKVPTVLHLVDLKAYVAISVPGCKLNGKGSAEHPSSTAADVAPTSGGPRQPLHKGIDRRIAMMLLDGPHQVGYVHVGVVIFDKPVLGHRRDTRLQKTPYLHHEAVDVLQRGDVVASAGLPLAAPEALGHGVRAVAHLDDVGHLDHGLGLAAAHLRAPAPADVCYPVMGACALHDEGLHPHRLRIPVPRSCHCHHVQSQAGHWQRIFRSCRQGPGQPLPTCTGSRAARRCRAGSWSGHHCCQSRSWSCSCRRQRCRDRGTTSLRQLDTVRFRCLGR
mmetsp:Transcript_665/g.1332  ORF Transcript_665/g.1332 Transcript_665/m.1332 type:complete len:280 (-) Transcript_665:211-1050(-)